MAKLNDLTAQEHQVIVDKGTEHPFTGEYDDFFEGGRYVCRQCDAPLYRSEDKFQSHCGGRALTMKSRVRYVVRQMLTAAG
jgi:peptide-methionine (R)-S-oxide reductase